MLIRSNRIWSWMGEQKDEEAAATASEATKKTKISIYVNGCVKTSLKLIWESACFCLLWIFLIMCEAFLSFHSFYTGFKLSDKRYAFAVVVTITIIVVVVVAVSSPLYSSPLFNPLHTVQVVFDVVVVVVERKSHPKSFDGWFYRFQMDRFTSWLLKFQPI